MSRNNLKPDAYIYTSMGVPVFTVKRIKCRQQKALIPATHYFVNTPNSKKDRHSQGGV